VSITIHDVARRARVSVTTVSRALTEPRLVEIGNEHIASQPLPRGGAVEQRLACENGEAIQ